MATGVPEMHRECQEHEGGEGFAGVRWGKSGHWTQSVSARTAAEKLGQDHTWLPDSPLMWGSWHQEWLGTKRTSLRKKAHDWRLTTARGWFQQP